MRISDWSSDVCSSDLHLGGERGLIVYGLDRGEPGLDRLGALRGDRGLVHETRVEIADLRAGLLLGRLQNAAGAPERKILERVEHAVARTVGGERRLRLPRSEERPVGKKFVRKCSSRWSP